MGMFKQLKDYCVSGRGCLFRKGKYAGRVAFIHYSLSKERVIVVGPTTQVPRHVTKRVNVDLLPLKLKGAKVSESAPRLRSHIAATAMIQQSKNTFWYRAALALRKERSKNDFDRFKDNFEHNKNAIIPVVLKKRRMSKKD